MLVSRICGHGASPGIPARWMRASAPWHAAVMASRSVTEAWIASSPGPATSGAISSTRRVRPGAASLGRNMDPTRPAAPVITMTVTLVTSLGHLSISPWPCSPARPGGCADGVSPACSGHNRKEEAAMGTSISDLGAEAARQHRDYGAGSLIVCDRLVRIYIAAGIEVQALQGLDLLVDEAEVVALVGASGSGKSTLMNILAGLDTPTAGSVRVAGNDLAAMNARQRLAYRRKVVGFIWQQTTRNLLPYLTSQQNVELPMRLSGVRAKTRRERSAELLELLGLGDCLHRRPDQMSGGEQQRAAIAVALTNDPKVLLADEPTGELDSQTAAEVFSALQKANVELGVTVLIVTHDPAVSSVVRRVVAIRDGRTSTEILRDTLAGDGDVVPHAIEYAVLDRAGRLQLPREMTEPLGMRGLVRLEAEPDHIGVWPGQQSARKPQRPEEVQ